MDSGLTSPRSSETEAHLRLKRQAALWAQAQGFSICAAEVMLPKCRYRADLAAYRPSPNELGITAIFECKQALADLRRDNCISERERARLASVQRRREILERNLRVHYPTSRAGDSLFPEFDSHDFAMIKHRSYTRVTREVSALQNKLYDATKFECLVRYRCANLFFVVLPNELFREPELPLGWGALIETNGILKLVRKPVFYDSAESCRLKFLQRIAAAGTRHLNRQFKITHDELTASRFGAPFCRRSSR